MNLLSAHFLLSPLILVSADSSVSCEADWLSAIRQAVPGFSSEICSTCSVLVRLGSGGCGARKLPSHRESASLTTLPSTPCTLQRSVTGAACKISLV